MLPQVVQIAGRVKELREILDIDANQIADNISVPVDVYYDYENGKLDIPIGKLYLIANALGVDPTVLLIGDDPRMGDYTVVRQGNGIEVERHKGYKFTSLAYNYVNRDMEPMIVTINPDETPGDLLTHEGQEFNYVLEGVMAVTIGNKELILYTNDSIYFNPKLPHGQRAIGNKQAKFLTVINE